MDYYEVLGVGREATQQEIKKAYLRAAKATHPDANPGGGAEVRRAFEQAAEAYETLGDKAKRFAYDRVLRQAEGDGGSALDEYLKRAGHHFRQGEAQRERRQEEQRRTRERHASAQEAWEQEKREARRVRERHLRTTARAAKARGRKVDQVLRGFWQTRGGVLWQDLAVLAAAGACLGASAAYWTGARPHDRRRAGAAGGRAAS